MSGNRNTSCSSSSSGSGNSSRSRSRSSSDNSHVSCPICSERYGKTDKIYGGSCGHVFHWHCLKRWWEESNNCPICRKSCEDYFQLYLNFEELDQSQSHNPGGNTSRAGTMNEYENLLYESGLYRDEIEYLNARIAHLTLKLFGGDTEDSD